MDAKYTDYLRYIEALSQLVAKTVKSEYEYWMPEEPQPISLFGEVGRSIVQDVENMTQKQRGQIFQHIETGMLSDDDELATAVATGLVEGIVTETDSDESLWIEIESYLGEKSREHAIAWRNFGQ
ncbi:MAG: DUF7674 family protein [Enterobacteriaceae bacterium]